MTKNLLASLQRLLLRFSLTAMDVLERRVAQTPGAHRWTEDSPVCCETMKERLQRRSGPNSP